MNVNREQRQGSARSQHGEYLYVSRPRVKPEFRGKRLALDVAGCATILGVPAYKVRRLIRSGQLKAVDVSAGSGLRPRWRVTHEDLDEFIKRRSS